MPIRRDGASADAGGADTDSTAASGNCCELSTPYCAKTGRTPTPDIDYKKLVVERNAPRWIRMLKQHGFLTKAQAAARG